MNLHRRYPYITLSAAAALLAVAGCGGSTPPGANGSPSTSYGSSGGTARGESTPGGAAAASAAAARPASALPKSRLGLFVTATPSSGAGAYSHVWATIHKVELLDAADRPVTVFDSPEGVTVDLASLHDISGARFAPLASAPVAGGTSYTRARLTFARTFTLFGSGSPTGEMAPLSDSVARDAEGLPALSFPLSRPRDLGTGKEDLVIDFDLAKMAVKDGRVIPSLREGDGARLSDASRQEPLVLTGTVAEVTSGGASAETTFLLTSPDGRTAYVQTAGATALFNDGTAANPAVADGRRVQVRGYLSPDTKRLVAASVKVYGGDETGPSASAAGFVLRADSAGGTLVLRPLQVVGLVPTQDAVTVTLTPDAVLRSRGGLKLSADDFWAAAGKNGAHVRVEGVYEPVTGALAATRARLEDASAAPSEAHEADVTGVPSASDEKSGTITVAAPLVEWDGLLAPGAKDGAKGLPIAVTPATALRDEKGEFVAASTFFAALKDGKAAVRVVGVYAKGTLTATRAELRPAPAKPEPVAKSEEKTAAGLTERKPDAPATAAKTGEDIGEAQKADKPAAQKSDGANADEKAEAPSAPTR
jgi:hypothetical protein